jgi:D-sedoheptulose 7-phosphate isomerase
LVKQIVDRKKVARFRNPGGNVLSPDQIQNAASYFSILGQAASSLDWNQIDFIARLLHQAYQDEKTTFLFGNGGSAALASHFACDLAKGTWIQGTSGKRFRAVALTDNLPMLTAWANDSGYEDVFAEQLRGFIQPDDVALAISCSGNSRNVLKALEVAREAGAVTVGLGGFDGGFMRSLCDTALIVSSDNIQIIEDLHLSVAHCLFTLMRNHIVQEDLKKVVAARAS